MQDWQLQLSSFLTWEACVQEGILDDIANFGTDAQDFEGSVNSTPTHFHFDALVRSMVGMLARRDNPTPFVFLVDGPWGSGKTSLMRSVMR